MVNPTSTVLTDRMLSSLNFLDTRMLSCLSTILDSVKHHRGVMSEAVYVNLLAKAVSA